MTISVIDHLIITARDLDSGAAFVRQILGVTPQVGGKHERMGTHNLLLRLGDKSYLEVIAIDPDAPSPSRPRWFGLDRFPAHASPALSGWAARTTAIEQTATAASEALGQIEAMARGALSWRITIPPDGSFPMDGAAPALIEWDGETHPASNMPDKGLSLQSLQIFHADADRVARLLKSIAFEGPVSVAAIPCGAMPYLSARIETPAGLRELVFAAPGS